VTERRGRTAPIDERRKEKRRRPREAPSFVIVR
jgi:hypothetical protein